MSAERENLYRVIHKAVRATLARLVTEAGRTDFGSAQAVGRLQQSLEETYGLLEEHVSGPDSAWYALRVDDNAIYYFHGGAIIRRLK